MSILRHYLFFNLESNLEFKKLKDSYYMNDNNIYKLDVVENELYFLQANDGLKDINYSNSNLKFEDIKTKSLKYKRAVINGEMVEEFKNFFVCTNLDHQRCEGLNYDEYERLKLTLVYGLKAKNLGISIGLAIRIYLFHLSLQGKNDEIKELLEEFSFIYEDDIINTFINSNDDFLTNLSCIVLDNERFYTNDCANKSFSKIFAKVLRLNAVKVMKNKKSSDKLLLLLDFLDFFKAHKKLDFKEKIKKGKNIKKISKKISKIARTFYIG